MPCDNPRGYVLTIFRRDVDEFVKRHVRIIASIDNRADGYAGVPGGNAGEIERRLFVRELLERMDDVARVILIRRVEGDSPAEIGHDLGISPNAVSIRLSRAISRLRKEVSHEVG